MTKGSALAPFRQPVFRAIWLATLMANFGAMLQSTGAAWMMTSLTGSPRMVALVQSSATLPIMLLALFSGAVADSYDRRRVMLIAQFVMLFASIILALLTFLDEIQPAVLLACTLVVGCGSALHGPSWQASIRAQVPIEDLPAAVSLNALNYNVARSIGPAIGGALMALFGPAANFTVNACSYVALIVVLLRWRPRFDHAPQREPLAAAVRTGVVTAYSTAPVRSALLRGAVVGLGAAGLSALMPIIARELLHGDQSEFALILGAFGGGSIAGSLLAARARWRFGSEAVFSGSILLYATGAAGAALSSSTPATMIAAALGGAAWIMLLSTINVTVQMAAPHEVVGRCLSLYHMHAFGAVAIGSVLWGSVAEHYGAATALLASAIVLAVSPLLALVLPLPGRITPSQEEAAA